MEVRCYQYIFSIAQPNCCTIRIIPNFNNHSALEVPAATSNEVDENDEQTRGYATVEDAATKAMALVSKRSTFYSRNQDQPILLVPDSAETEVSSDECYICYGGGGE